MFFLERKVEIGIYEFCLDYIFFSKYMVVFFYYGFRLIFDFIYIIYLKEIKIDLLCYVEINIELNYFCFF